MQLIIRDTRGSSGLSSGRASTATSNSANVRCPCAVRCKTSPKAEAETPKLWKRLRLKRFFSLPWDSLCLLTQRVRTRGAVVRTWLTRRGHRERGALRGGG